MISAAISAHRCPSIADETIPPAKPEPSPAGYNPFTSGCSSVFFERGIRIGEEQQYDPVKKIIGRVDIKIHVPSDFPEKYENAVIQAASLCAVKRHLRDDIELNVMVDRK